MVTPTPAEYHLDSWAQLREFTDRVGPYMGSDIRSMFLYVVVRLHRPQRLLELGTGFGVSALWLARGLLENADDSRLHVADRGFTFTPAHREMFHESELRDTFPDYFHSLLDRHGLTEKVRFLHTSFPPFPHPELSYDLIYSDFKHGPSDLLDILGFYLPKMSDTSNFFIDSAPSLFGSYVMLKQLLDMFAAARVPELLLQRIDPTEREAFKDFVWRNCIEMVPVTENIDRSQNAFAWLRIQPHDLMPRPLHRYRLDKKFFMSSPRINRT